MYTVDYNCIQNYRSNTAEYEEAGLPWLTGSNCNLERKII